MKRIIHCRCSVHFALSFYVATNALVLGFIERVFDIWNNECSHLIHETNESLYKSSNRKKERERDWVSLYETSVHCGAACIYSILIPSAKYLNCLSATYWFPMHSHIRCFIAFARVGCWISPFSYIYIFCSSDPSDLIYNEVSIFFIPDRLSFTKPLAFFLFYKSPGLIHSIKYIHEHCTAMPLCFCRNFNTIRVSYSQRSIFFISRMYALGFGKILIIRLFSSRTSNAVSISASPCKRTLNRRIVCSSHTSMYLCCMY